MSQLTEYNKKRSFKITPEPKGEVKKTNGKTLHFVVQKHDASHLHYDFRLELDGVLKSWAVPKGPSMNPKDKRLAMMTEDHPLSYGTFEGEIPAGQYGAGDVIVWDTGVYQSDEVLDPEESRKKLKSGLNKGELSFVLLGKKLRGKFTLVHMKERGENAWLLIKAKDEYASEEDVTKDVSSVLSKSLLKRDQISTVTPPVKKVITKKTAAKKSTKQDPMPTKVKPMLAKLGDTPFDKKDWLFELKWDGYRAIAEIDCGKVKLYSRNGLSFTDTYTPIVEVLKKFDHRCVLDGEIIALKDGKPDFHTLQQYKVAPKPLRYVVFDLLYLDGEDLRSRPLRERKDLLKSIIIDCELTYSDHVEEKGVDFFSFVTKESIEGMVAKDANSIYREGVRSDSWIKIKTHQEQEAIIIGYTKPRGSRQHLGALVLGAYIEGKLRYIGHSGGGFGDKELKDLYAKLEKIKTNTSPVAEKVPINSEITWVKPQYVCQISFTEWTKSGRMRHPIYKGLRVDKKASEVGKEVAAHSETLIKKPAAKKQPAKKKTEGATLTHLDKVYWPEEGYTKGDLIHYYDEMADILLPYLKDRPQNLNRHPNGINGQNFFQKNMDMKLPSFVETKRIWSESNNDYLEYIVCNNKETLLYLANLGCIELNPWNSRTQKLDRPDYMIFDLDPKGRAFSDVITVAKEVKRVLDLSCETSFPKTSGKSGLHIVVPLGARYTYDDVRRFSELVMRIVHRHLPDLTSLERSPSKRGGKIYLDYLQNRFGQTLACAYSVRPYPGATVSTPLEWKEVKQGLDPGTFTIKNTMARLKKKGDLWQPVMEQKNDLGDAIKCLEEELEL